MSEERDRLVETASRLADACFSLAERSKQQAGTQVKTNEAIHAVVGRISVLTDVLNDYVHDRRTLDQEQRDFQLWSREQFAVLNARTKDIEDDTGTFKTIGDERAQRTSTPPPEGKVFWALNVWRKMDNLGKALTIALFLMIWGLIAHIGLRGIEK